MQRRLAQAIEKIRINIKPILPCFERQYIYINIVVDIESKLSKYFSFTIPL